MKSRTGFTLIELLVTISIIGVLVGLLLPAVQTAREASRASHFAGNLKQIGLALYGYNDVMGCFPPDFMPYRTTVAPTVAPPPSSRTQWFSALTRILPYLEQNSVYHAINFSVELYPPANGVVPHPVNLTAYRTSVDTFLCPSDALSSSNRNNYRGNVGVGPAVAMSAESYDSGNGFLAYSRPHHVRHVPRRLIAYHGLQ